MGMHKKSYIYFFIIGTFLLVMLLPLFNYTVDRWRVLHSDYEHHYAGHMCNKTFLKTKYVIAHPKAYDTLLMGSSNGGYMDSTKISSHTYNMKYNFGLLAIHLQNLKTMLKQGVKIQNLWVGINDYIIWKDPKDYENSFERRPYKATILEDMKTYIFYLFRKPDITDWYLWRGRYRLVTADIITHPHPHTEAKKREDAHFKIPKKWKKHMKDIAPSLLRYDDTSYRIDAAIAEIKALKALCEKHHIHLTLFMYPAYYKNYILYNQSKIETFKRKLASVMPFYDFYRLNHRAYDAMKWQDGMHFAYSTGDFIINSIKQHKALVSVANIEAHLEEIKYEAKESLVHQEGMYMFHDSIDVPAKHIVFDLQKQYVYYKNSPGFTLKEKNATLVMDVKTYDTSMVLAPIATHYQKVFMSVDITSSQKTLLRLYYKDNPKDEYHESRRFLYRLKKGRNSLNIAIPSRYVNNGLRLNLVDDKDIYTIHKCMMYE